MLGRIFISFLCAAAACFLSTLALPALSANEASSVEFLVDCSRPMDDFFGNTGMTRMQAAKRTVVQATSLIPSKCNIGLRVFGQSFQNDPLIDCQQTSLLVPVGPDNGRKVIQSVQELSATGASPLAYAMREAAIDLDHVQGRKRIVIISIGHDSCGYDPCAFVRDMRRAGMNVRFDVLGLCAPYEYLPAISLECIAVQSGGNFYNCDSALELTNGLEHIASQVGYQYTVICTIESPDKHNLRIEHGAFLTGLSRRLRSEWSAPFNAKELTAVVSCGVNAGGDLTDARIEQSSEDESFDQSALNAVAKSSPFAPLPTAVGSAARLRLVFKSSLD